MVCVAGYFDPIHEGHFYLIQQAKKLGTSLIAIAGTESQCDKKHGNHFHSWEGKVALLEALGCDCVVPNSDIDGSCAGTLRRIQPDIFVVGEDYTPDTLPEYKVCREMGCEVRFSGKRLNRSSKYFESKSNKEISTKPQ